LRLRIVEVDQDEVASARKLRASAAAFGRPDTLRVAVYLQERPDLLEVRVGNGIHGERVIEAVARRSIRRTLADLVGLVPM
jgi:hypothetical protein